MPWLYHSLTLIYTRFYHATNMILPCQSPLDLSPTWASGPEVVAYVRWWWCMRDSFCSWWWIRGSVVQQSTPSQLRPSACDGVVDLRWVAFGTFHFDSFCAVLCIVLWLVVLLLNGVCFVLCCCFCEVVSFLNPTTSMSLSFPLVLCFSCWGCFRKLPNIAWDAEAS